MSGILPLAMQSVPVAPMADWLKGAQVAGTQASTLHTAATVPLIQQQTQGQAIQNALNQLGLNYQRWWYGQLENAAGGAPAAQSSPLGAALGVGNPGAGATGTSAPVQALPLGAPGAQSAAAPAWGGIDIGGFSMPRLPGLMALKDPAKAPASLKSLFDQRLQVLSTFATQATDPASWDSGLARLVNEGWMSPQRASQWLGNFAARGRFLQGLAPAAAQLGYQTALAKLGLQPNGGTGSPEIMPQVPAAAGAIQGARSGNTAVTLTPGQTRFLPPGAAAAAGAAPAAGAPPQTTPLGANNPGAVMPGGKLANYPTMAAGLQALDQNLAAYGKDGVNTLAGVITRWAPPGANNTPAYIADVAGRLGIAPNQRVDLSNPLQRQAIATAIALHENGPAAVFGAPAQAGPAPAAPTPAGSQPAPAPETGIPGFTDPGRGPTLPGGVSVSPAPGGGATVQSNITPAALATQQAQAKQWVEYQGTAADEASSAVTQNMILDQMQNESQSWTPGSFANSRESMLRFLDTAGRVVGWKPTQAIGDWEAFQKNAVQLQSAAAVALSKRAPVAEFQALKAGIPTDVMTPQGREQVTAELQGLNDWRIARAHGAANYTGTEAQFNSQWNKSVPLIPFILHRMPEESYVRLGRSLAATPAGRAMWQKWQSQWAAIHAGGVFNALPGGD